MGAEEKKTHDKQSIHKRQSGSLILNNLSLFTSLSASLIDKSKQKTALLYKTQK